MIKQRTFSEVVNALINARLLDVHTAFPARVVSYDRAKRTADVQPILKGRQRRETGNVIETMPVLQDVPVLFQSTSRNGVSFPLEAGDLVWVMFSEQDMDRLAISDGSVAAPRSYQRFTLRSPVCIPGFHTNVTVSDQSDADALVVHGDTIKLGSKTATAKVALVPGVQTAIAGALANPTILSAQAALLTAIGTGIPAAIETAQETLELTIAAYFTTSPVQGAQKVEAE